MIHDNQCCKKIKGQKQIIKNLRELLITMTALTRLKYGNLDKEVYAEIEKAEKLIEHTKE